MLHTTDFSSVWWCMVLHSLPRLTLDFPYIFLLLIWSKCNFVPALFATFAIMCWCSASFYNSKHPLKSGKRGKWNNIFIWVLNSCGVLEANKGLNSMEGRAISTSIQPSIWIALEPVARRPDSQSVTKTVSVKFYFKKMVGWKISMVITWFKRIFVQLWTYLRMRYYFIFCRYTKGQFILSLI